MNHTHRRPSVFPLFVALSLGGLVVMLMGSAHAADNRVFPANAIERHTNWLQYKAYTPDNELNPLPSASSVDVVQDSAGFIWFGVNSSGLVRFDGHQMEVYGFDDGVPSLLLNNMTLGPNGHLWVSTKAGLVVSHVPLDDNSATSSVTFRKTVGEVRLSESALDASVVWLGDDVWVIESDEARLLRYTWTTDDVLSQAAYEFDASMTGRVVSFAKVDEASVVFAGAEGLFEFNLESQDIRQLQLPTGCLGAKLAHTGSQGQAFVECNSGQLVGARDWPRWSEASVISDEGKKSSRRSKFINIADKVHFVGSDRYNVIDASLKVVESMNSSTFKTSSLTNVLLDREKNLWLASGNGFRKLSPQHDAFSAVVHKVEDVNFSMTSFDLTRNETILAAGGRQGLLLQEEDRQVVLTTKHGFPVDRIYAVRDTPYGLALGHARHYSFLKPLDAPRPQGLTGWRPLGVFGRPYELASVDARASDILNMKIAGKMLSVC